MQYNVAVKNKVSGVFIGTPELLTVANAPYNSADALAADICKTLLIVVPPSSVGVLRDRSGITFDIGRLRFYALRHDTRQAA